MHSKYFVLSQLLNILYTHSQDVSHLICYSNFLGQFRYIFNFKVNNYIFSKIKKYILCIFSNFQLLRFIILNYITTENIFLFLKSLMYLKCVIRIKFKILKRIVEWKSKGTLRKCTVDNRLIYRYFQYLYLIYLNYYSNNKIITYLSI